MEQRQKEIQRLMVRFLLEEITREERQILEQWRKEEEANEVLFDKVCNPQNIGKHLKGYMELDVDKALQRNQSLLKRLHTRKILRRVWPYAASVLIALGGVGLWLHLSEKESKPMIAQEMNPVGCQAELILGNGETVLLNAGIDTRIREGKSDIRINGNSVNYFSDSSALAVVFNTVRTPLGGEYSIILADGTKVWLNAMSELHYPVNFNGGERRVELKGEAYFEVAKDTLHPFCVTVADYQVKVLGTSFNITAYTDRSLVQTTLCTGKVDVRDLQANRSFILSPGEQANCDRRTRAVEVKKVDTDVYRAWTRGEFRFDNTSIEEIFQILQRWYKIEVFYTSNRVKEEVFSGKLPRFDNLQVILDIMEKVSDLRFEMQGNTLIVK